VIARRDATVSNEDAVDQTLKKYAEKHMRMVRERPMQPIRCALGVVILPLTLLLAVAPSQAHCEEPGVLEISGDTVLDTGRTYGGIVIKASNITIDGRGSWLIGKQDGKAKDFTGTAVLARRESDRDTRRRGGTGDRLHSRG
jgi:hypothetical protein